MKIKITNDGVEGIDAITIFIRHSDGTTENHLAIEGGETVALDWDQAHGTRYEVVPWLRVPPTQ